MDLERLIWLILPILVSVVLVVAAQRGSFKSQKGRTLGIILAVIIIIAGIIWRLTHGGF
jgi:hypothetical protein